MQSSYTRLAQLVAGTCIAQNRAHQSAVKPSEEERGEVLSDTVRVGLPDRFVFAFDSDDADDSLCTGTTDTVFGQPYRLGEQCYRLGNWTLPVYRSPISAIFVRS